MYSILTFLILGTSWTANCDRHSLTYIYTAFSTKPINPEIHEFTAMGLLDGKMIDYYDSTTKKKVPKERWMEERLDKDYWEKGTQSRQSKEQWFKVNLGILKERNRHSNDTGLHVLQWRHGCKAERQGDDSLKFISGTDEYSYDGDDFLNFDDANKRWIAPVDLALPTKRKWDEVKMLNDYTQGYLERECVSWLSKFVEYGKIELQAASPPELHVYCKKSKNPTSIMLHCMATGFYPPDIILNIRRNGQVLDELDGIQSTGVRPNGDGTFQIRKHVEILRSDTASYKCEVMHPATDMHKFEEWDPSMCKVDPQELNIGVIVGGVVAAGWAVIAIIVVVVILLKTRGRTSKTPSDSDSGSTISTDTDRSPSPAASTTPEATSLLEHPVQID